ncbi:DUF2283 domain-containing protein [Dankookia rubra]|uniref:DUF2283 domain-containing protein n=1 Tax=Dankookia rubra TaxID=1442381 RepID=A0A4R5Q775_9PROT|nr:DUF2283 domain-containing protein [Dankookia rubra]TDH58730.1 DUF2283 domain-containing protein [Dankookia rubra]
MTTDPRATYDPESDAIGIYFRPDGAKPGDSAEVAPGLTLDYDAHNRVVGVEILGVRDLLATGRTPPPDGSHLAPYAGRPDELRAALEAYVVAFNGEHAPFLRDVEDAEEVAVATAMLRHAVTKKRPLGWWQIMAALGHPSPSA